MKHTLAMALHDTKGTIFDLMDKITPTLDEIFDRVVFSISPKTEEILPERVKKLGKNVKFVLVGNKPGTMVGDHYLNVIQSALISGEDDEMIHIGCPDRVSVAVIKHKNDYINDMEMERNSDKPILYERSDLAWSTHPRNYMAIEKMGDKLGEELFGRELDYFWCDMAIPAKVVKKYVEGIKTNDMRVLAEILLPVRNDVVVKKVDWLEWEDPFLFGKDTDVFKKELEDSVDEDNKRLDYVMATVKWLLDKSRS